MGTSNDSDEFKRDAVHQITARGYPVREVSQRLGVGTHSFYKWMKPFGEPASKARGIDLETENRRLKRELAEVTEERDILTKVKPFSATGPRTMVERVRRARPMTYTFTRAHREKFGVRGMCRVLQVHFSGFYAWVQEPLPKARSREGRVPSSRCEASARKPRSTTNWPIFECSLSTSAALTCSGAEPRRVKAVAMFTIAARFHVPICVGWTPYFFGSSASVNSSVRRFSRSNGGQRLTASSTTLALNSGEWFFRFFILNRHFHHAIHLNEWPIFPRPPL